jgi:hypothetical protein
MRLGLSGVIWLGLAARAVGAEGGAKSEPLLEIMSLDPGDHSLGVSWPWGAMAANHVMFNDHRGPFKAIVESSGQGVRVTFEGWGEEPFAATADRIRVIYRVAGRTEIDFAAEAITGGAVRIRAVGRPVTQGRRIVIGLGRRHAAGGANVSVEGRRD